MDMARQYFWVKYQKFLPCMKETYDVVIDFRSEIGCYFMIDKINAEKKIGWYHGVYSNYVRNKAIDEAYWRQLTCMVSISMEGKENLIENFPFLGERVYCIPNIISANEISKLAKEKIDMPYEKDAINIVSVGRLDYEKNYTLAIDVADTIRNYGYKLRWVIVGEGTEFNNLKNKIEQLNLSHEIYLVGRQNNPYPFINNAMFFVHTSLMEGKPIVIEEAKVLDKIIITTSFPTAKNQIQDGFDGRILPFKASALAKEIITIYEDKKLQAYYRRNLKNEQKDRTNNISCLYSIIEG